MEGWTTSLCFTQDGLWVLQFTWVSVVWIQGLKHLFQNTHLQRGLWSLIIELLRLLKHFIPSELTIAVGNLSYWLWPVFWRTEKQSSKMSPETGSSQPTVIFKCSSVFLAFLKVFGRIEQCFSSTSHANFKANFFYSLPKILRIPPVDSVKVWPLSKCMKLLLSLTLWKMAFWNSSVFIVLSITGLSLPWGAVCGPSQNFPGLFSILFFPGNWTLNSLSSVVNNTETWYAFQCLFCLAVTDSTVGMADSHTGCVGSFSDLTKRVLIVGEIHLAFWIFFFTRLTVHYNINNQVYATVKLQGKKYFKKVPFKHGLISWMYFAHVAVHKSDTADPTLVRNH